MSEWIETYRGAILASEYDPETFMNSMIYVTRFDQATWFLLSAVGVTPATAKTRKRRVAVFRQNIELKEELRGGQLVIVKSGFIAVGEKYLRFVHRMTDIESGNMIATADCTAAEADLDGGRAKPLPKAVRGGAEKHIVTRSFNDR